MRKGDDGSGLIFHWDFRRDDRISLYKTTKIATKEVNCIFLNLRSVAAAT